MLTVLRDNSVRYGKRRLFKPLVGFSEKILRCKRLHRTMYSLAGSGCNWSDRSRALHRWEQNPPEVRHRQFILFGHGDVYRFNCFIGGSTRVKFEDLIEADRLSGRPTGSFSPQSDLLPFARSQLLLPEESRGTPNSSSLSVTSPD